jgi:subfamily B ATP-binding cassette protein HlyB/CyaB
MDTGAVCLVLLARFFGLPADEPQLRHQFGQSGQPLTATDLLLAAKHLGLKAKEVKSQWTKLTQTELPAIAQHHDGHYFIIGKIEGDQVLIQDPLDNRPLIWSRAQLESAWSGTLILITRRAGIAAEASRKFDFSWFIPAIIKYRRLFGEVLIASFFIQLLALATPLFFQVVIDKVLAHKGLTTLDVLVFGLLVVSLFEVLLGGLRTYLYSHTAHRIDVALGAKLFRHLLALPIAYFEARRVGDTVARVRELESIRQFLTGSALTVVIDALFTVVIFDEATSALDYESERIIQNNMNDIARGRTVFIIAHRLSTVRHAHRIIVIDKGEVVEPGNHHELLQHNGEYAKLHQMQMG